MKGFDRICSALGAFCGAAVLSLAFAGVSVFFSEHSINRFPSDVHVFAALNVGLVAALIEEAIHRVQQKA